MAKPHEHHLTRGEGDTIFLPACKSRHLRKKRGMPLSQLFLSNIVISAMQIQLGQISVIS